MTDVTATMPLICVGLDMSLTSTGLCLKEGNTIRLDTVKTKPDSAENDLARLNLIVEKVMSFIPQSVDMICIEDFFTPSNPMQIGSAIKLAMLGTAIRLRLYNAGFKFFVIAPSQLKKYVTGKGSGEKSMILKEVYKRWGIEAKDDNQADACVLAHLAEGLLVPDETRPEFQRDVIKTVKADRPNYNVKG